MYLSKEKILDKLKIDESELLFFRESGHMKYSKNKDKYDYNSVLEKRTMTIGLEKYLDENQKEEIIEKMKRYSSFKHTLVKKIQQGEKFSNSGTNRIHRKMAKNKYSFGVHIADSALASAKGVTDSADSWYKITIKNLEQKILKRSEQLEELKLKKFHKNFTKGKKKQLQILKNKLAKYQSKSYLKIHFGKNAEDYKKARLEYFSSGSAANGNPEIKIIYKNGFKLKLFKSIFNVKIPNSHKNTFTLENYNCQSSRISYNNKGKLVLHLTYSYIKPVEKTRYLGKNGTVGIDIGPKEIAVCFVKKDGNPDEYLHFSIGNLLDKKSKDTQRNLSKILDKILKIAESKNIFHITIENLKFKENYKYKSKKLNRMLSKFPHQIFEDLMKGKCSRRGMQLKLVNPAFTSVIGIYKYSNRDNLSSKHNAKSKDLSAALVIGRRGLGMKERAVVCVKVSSEMKSVKISSLFEESEKDSSKTKMRRKTNWGLWMKLKSTYTFEQLTAVMFVPLGDPNNL